MKACAHPFKTPASGSPLRKPAVSLPRIARNGRTNVLGDFPQTSAPLRGLKQAEALGDMLDTTTAALKALNR